MSTIRYFGPDDAHQEVDGKVEFWVNGQYVGEASDLQYTHVVPETDYGYSLSETVYTVTSETTMPLSAWRAFERRLNYVGAPRSKAKKDRRRQDRYLRIMGKRFLARHDRHNHWGW